MLMKRVITAIVLLIIFSAAISGTCITLYISLHQNHLHGLIEPVSRRMRTILRETEPTLCQTKCQV